MVSNDVARRVGDRYALNSPLGSGGSGTVWAAHDEVLQRPVAVKAVGVPDAVPDDERTAGRERVLREARAAARLNHPGAVTVFDVFDEAGSAYIVMELVQAPSLATLVERDGPMDDARVAEIGLQLLDALEAAHAKGIVHRDVKPSNVLVTDAGSAKLTDFGIATVAGDSRITATGLVLGSPSYIAPEQARQGAGQSAADLWGLGATLYFAVEGCPPFERDHPLATVHAVVNEEPRPAERAGGLAPLLTDLLTKDPARRPAPADVRRRLQEVAAGGGAATATTPVEETVVAPPQQPAPPRTTPAPPQQPAPRRTGDAPPSWRRPAVMTAVVALLVLGGFAGASALLGGQEDPAPEDEQAGEAPADDVPPAGDAPAGDPPTAGESPADDSPAEPAEEAPPSEGEAVDDSGAVPDDWVTYTSDVGWSVAHPPDWEIVPQGSLTDFRDPRSSTYLRVDYTDDPPASAVGAWEELSASFAQRHANYNELRIEPVTYKGFDGALWEYTYSESGRDLRATNLGFGTDEFGQALNFVTAADAWGDGQELQDAFRASFEPATG